MQAALKESVIETLCDLPFGVVDGGFRVFAQIPMVRLRRGRFWITSRDAAGRSLPGILNLPLHLSLIFPRTAGLVRQLRGPHLRNPGPHSTPGSRLEWTFVFEDAEPMVRKVMLLQSIPTMGTITRRDESRHSACAIIPICRGARFYAVPG